MEDKAVGRVTEAAGSLTGDETLEAEGRALGERGREVPTGYLPSQKGDSGNRRAGQISSGHRTNDQAVRRVRELAKAHEPSQVLNYKKDGTVQTERTYR
jgi:hypothetical protein